MDTDRNRRPILLVEDNADVRQSMKWLLQVQGYPVATAIHGADALRRLRAGLDPCLILLDLHMPEMDGFEFRKAQIEDPQLASLPVVVYSGLSDPHTSAAQLKAVAYLQKPFDIDTLLTVIEAHCGAGVPTGPSAPAGMSRGREPASRPAGRHRTPHHSP